MRQQIATLTDFAQRLDQDRFNKRDFVADTRHLFARVDGIGQVILQASGDPIDYKINNHAHGQIASKLSIPKIYYDRLLKQHPQLLTKNINTLFQEEPERRMVRALDGTARAYLSDKFRIDMDNYDVANAALPVLHEVPELDIKSLAVTDTRMYIKALFPRITGQVKVGQEVQAGIVISNSEVGAGSLRIEPLVYVLECTNGMISGTAIKKFHVGARQGMSDEAYEVLTQATRDKSAEAIRAIVHDVVVAATNALDFEKRLEVLRMSANERLVGDIPKAIELLGNKLNINQSEQSDVLRHLIEGGDVSKWGLANAVTRTSQDIDDYDRATEFERIGGRVIDLSANDWQQVAEAA